MPNFIQCLIQGHKNTDKEAIKLYREADKRARAKAEASGEEIYGGDEVAEELRLLLIRQLVGVDLQSEEIYADLEERNWNWQARVSSDDVGYCATVQLILNGTLPDCREQQRDPLLTKCGELLAGCEEYKRHLEKLNEKEVRKVRATARKNGLYHEVNPQSSKIEEINHQIGAVELLIGALRKDGVPEKKLENFQQIYNENIERIEAGHDSATDKFKNTVEKVVKSILYILKGKAKDVSLIWKSPAEKLVEKVPEGFKPVKKPYTKI